MATASSALICIMPTVYSNLHIVVSDDPEGHLPNWLLNRIDRSFRLRFALEAQGCSVWRNSIGSGSSSCGP